jgi:hypothetical protein
MRLIKESTGIEVKSGDVAHDFRGEAAIVTGWQEPRHSGSTGRVYVKEMGDKGFTGEYYPSVYGMKWVD